MRIAYVGNFSQAHCTEVHVAASLESLGHEVVRLQEQDQNHADRLLATASECDLLLWTRTKDLVKLRDADWLGVLWGLRKHDVPTASFHLDLYLGIKRGDGVSSKDPFWATEYVFTADGGHQDRFRELGINHYHIPPGAFLPECYEGTFRREYEADVIFVGSYRYHDEWPYRPRLIDALKKRYGNRFQLWGHGRPIRGAALNDLYASARVVVGDSLYSPNYWSDRYTETMGRGGFLVAPVVEGLDAYYQAGVHFAPFDNERGAMIDFSPLFRVIDHYLEREDQREKIRRAGHEHVKAYHTFAHRMERMLYVLRDDGRLVV